MRCSAVFALGVMAAPAAAWTPTMSGGLDRRSMLKIPAGVALGVGLPALRPNDANAVVYFDPAMYGDQENRLAAVSSCEGRVRETIAKKPELAPAFLKLALLDGLSFDGKKSGGGDGSAVAVVASAKPTTNELKRLQEAAKVLLEISNRQRDSTNMKSVDLVDSVTLGDAVALGGAAAIESVGCPTLSVQLGRTERDGLRADLKKGGVQPTAQQAVLLAAFTRDDLVTPDPASEKAVADAFRASSLTDRELTVLLGALLVLEKSEKVPQKNYKGNKGKLRERGKLGRASEFKKLTAADLEQCEFDCDDDDEYVGPAGERDEGIDIVDSFGSASEKYGGKASNDVSAATFNKYFVSLNSVIQAGKKDTSNTIWIERVLILNPQSTQWVNSYSQSNLKYLKDLRTAYYAVTQLGQVFTGGKYEKLLGDKKRKTLANVED